MHILAKTLTNCCGNIAKLCLESTLNILVGADFNFGFCKCLIPFSLQGCDGFRPLQRMSADALTETLIREGESEVEVVTR